MRHNKNTIFLIFVIILETIVIKFSIYRILPAKFFYDSNGILSLMNNNYYLDDTSRMFTVNFFKSINFLGFVNIKQWGYSISFIFTIITIYLISKYKKFNMIQNIFIILSIALLNIFVYTIGKDIIQFLIFLIMYIILKKEKYSNVKKIILISILLALESIFFRVYYLIMAVLIITIYILYKIFIKDKKTNRKSLTKIFFLTVFVLFLEIIILRFISVKSYNSIMYARSSVNIFRENDVDAQSIIIDLLGTNTNFCIFAGNYIINFARMIFPIELIFKSIKYIPFIIYQLMITYAIIKDCKRISDNNILCLATIIGYLMVSTLFEPDFGSFIRHESTTFLILLELFKDYSDEKNYYNGG